MDASRAWMTSIPGTSFKSICLGAHLYPPVLPSFHEIRLICKSRRSIFGRRDRRDGDIGYVADWGLFVYARRNDLLAEVPRIKGASGEPC